MSHRKHKQMADYGFQCDLSPTQFRFQIHNITTYMYMECTQPWSIKIKERLSVTGSLVLGLLSIEMYFGELTDLFRATFVSLVFTAICKWV